MLTPPTNLSPLPFEGWGWYQEFFAKWSTIEAFWLHLQQKSIT